MASFRKSPSTKDAASSRARSPKPAFLDLPGEVLSHVASYLSLEEAIGFLSLHRILLNVARTHLSPIPAMIRRIVYSAETYPPVLSRLPHMTLLLPDDGGHMFLDVLVCARPRWILERLELGRWSDTLWKEAFERRFLPSWKRYKVDDDTWRMVFLRNGGCTHEESWTRFITLHRNGSASINRIYSRSFDPYQIFDELKHQNNFRSEPTTVRVILHLQDIRIIALGVLYAHPNLFVNQNAHNLLHPPLLNSWTAEAEAEAEIDDFYERKGGSGKKRQQSPGRKPMFATPEEGRRRELNRHHRLSEPVISTLGNTGVGPSSSSSGSGGHPSAITNEAYYPLVRSITPSGPDTTSYGLGEGPMPIGGVSAPGTRRSTFSGLFSTYRRASQVSPSPDTAVSYSTSQLASSSMSRLGARLTLTRSRDSDDMRARKWSFGRRGSAGSRRSSGSEKGAPTIPAAALFAQPNGTGSTASIPSAFAAFDAALGGSPQSAISGGPGRVIPAAALFTDYASTSAPGPSILAGGGTVGAAITAGMTRSGSNVASTATGDNIHPANTQPDISPPSNFVNLPLTPPKTPVPATRKQRQLPYPPLTKPQPVVSHRLYPNFTPRPAPSAPDDADENEEKVTEPSVPPVADADILFDRRQLHEEIEDDYTGNLWASRKGHGYTHEDGNDWGDEERRVEWDEGESKRKRWVGPMIMVCQLHPNYHPRAQPPGVNRSLATEGANPELGPHGMYMSLGFEDLEAIMGWVELKGGGAYVTESRRGGMGFEQAGG